MHLKKASAKICALIIYIASISGCAKTENIPIEPVKPKPGLEQEDVVNITSLSVNHGAYNQIVTISGSGFSGIISENKVLFNNKQALVTAASATQLTVNVPLSAGTGNVVVTANKRSVIGPLFTYDYTFMKTVLAGSETMGYADGKGTAARFSGPTGIVVNSTGDVFVADAYNSVIRKITKDGIVSTFAGNRTKATKDGTGTNATFDFVIAMAIDKADNLFVAEGKGLVRKITPSAVVTTIAGSSTEGFTNGNGPEARFNGIEDITVNSNGDILVTDRGNSAIRKISSTGQVSTFYQADANFGFLTAITFDSKDNLYFTDTSKSFTSPNSLLYQLNNSTATPININSDLLFMGLPLGVTVDEKGNKYILGEGGKLLKINTTGENKLLNSAKTNKAVNSLKPNMTQSYSALGIAVDKDEVCYIITENQILKIGLQ